MGRKGNVKREGNNKEKEGKKSLFYLVEKGREGRNGKKSLEEPLLSLERKEK